VAFLFPQSTERKQKLFHNKTRGHEEMNHAREKYSLVKKITSLLLLAFVFTLNVTAQIENYIIQYPAHEQNDYYICNQENLLTSEANVSIQQGILITGQDGFATFYVYVPNWLHDGNFHVFLENIPYNVIPIGFEFDYTLGWFAHSNYFNFTNNIGIINFQIYAYNPPKYGTWEDLRFTFGDVYTFLGKQFMSLLLTYEFTLVIKPEPTPYVRRPMVALTFDDGPSAHTERIVNTLEYHNARATFFVIGRRLQARRDIVLRAYQLGNEIANHLFHHQVMTVMYDHDIIADIQAGSNAIISIIGESPPIIRPPAGAVNDRIANVVGNLGYALIMWSIDTHDWRDRNADVIYQRIMSNVRDGDIILLHDTHLTTAIAMERVIPSLIERGFYLVTVSELLRYVYGYDSPRAGHVYFYAR